MSCLKEHDCSTDWF